MHLRPDHHHTVRHHPSIAYGSMISMPTLITGINFDEHVYQTDIERAFSTYANFESNPLVAYHRVLTRFGEGFGPVATRLLQRASWRGTEVSPRPVVWCLTGCCTFDPASPSTLARAL